MPNKFCSVFWNLLVTAKTLLGLRIAFGDFIWAATGYALKFGPPRKCSA